MEKVLRLIIVEDDLNDAEMMISAVKSTGVAVRAERAESLEDFGEKLTKHAPDVILLNLEARALNLEEALGAVREAGKHVPVIAVSNADAGSPIEYMQLGAEDLVRKDQPEHLKLVITRTANCQQQWRRLKSLESSLREAEKRCKTLLNSSRDAIAYVHEGMHIFANESYLELFGYTDIDDVEGTPIMDMVSSEEQQKLKDFLRGYNKGGDPNQTLDITLRDNNDKDFGATMEFSHASIDGEACTQIVIRNQGDAKELEQQLNYLAQRDLVTGLFNRQHFMEQLDAAMGRASQGEAASSLLNLTIDKFDDIKNSVGVSGADLVIADVGKVLDETCDATDVVARFEGEAFAVLTPRRGEKDIQAFMDKLLQAVSEHICEVEGKSITCTVSIGVTLIDENAPDANELLVRADKALKEAQTGEGNKGVIYKPKKGEMTQKQIDEEWSETIRKALKEDRLRLLFQPIVSLHGDPGERYEVYLRLVGEDGNTITPTEFLPSAERTGVAKGLDRWVLINAFKRLAEQRQKKPDTIFFVKLTAGSLLDGTMLPWISEKLKEHRMPAESLVIEMKTETILNYLKQAKEFVKGLTQLKCSFALDEFGSGLDPFKLLKHVPAEYLKIDRSFMDDMITNPENQEAIRNMTDMAHSMNKLTVAQFVEDPNALSVLWGMGVNYIQGNFLQQPQEDLKYDFSAMG